MITEQVPKREVRIEDWSCQNNQLYGRVFGHPRFKDGEQVRSSPILSEDKESGKIVTLNTTYVLGKEFTGKVLRGR